MRETLCGASFFKNSDESSASVHVEHFFQGLRNGREVGVGLHDVRHILPPSVNHGILTQILRRLFPLLGLNGEKSVAPCVEIDRVVPDSRCSEKRFQLGPDRVVPANVLFPAATFQFHRKGKSLHGQQGPSGQWGFEQYPIFLGNILTLSLVWSEMSVPSLGAYEMVVGVPDNALVMSLVVSLQFV